MVSRILIIDGDQNMLELFQLILEPEGYEVHLSIQPFDYPIEVEHISPSLIILDLEAGHHAQGISLLQQFIMYAPTMRIPILICTTALREMFEQQELFRQKGIPIIYKPFNIDELLDVVHHLLPPPSEGERAPHTCEQRM